MSLRTPMRNHQTSSSQPKRPLAMPRQTAHQQRPATASTQRQNPPYRPSPHPKHTSTATPATAATQQNGPTYSPTAGSAKTVSASNSAHPATQASKPTRRTDP